jgi:transcriptional regulator with XRE-family HTH domain
LLEAFHEVKDARGLTYGELAEKTRQLDGKGITSSYITSLANGYVPPSMRAMELIARACGVQPDYFAEYRLAARRRRALNELGDRTTRPVGEALCGLKDARGLTYPQSASRRAARNAL